MTADLWGALLGQPAAPSSATPTEAVARDRLAADLEPEPVTSPPPAHEIMAAVHTVAVRMRGWSTKAKLAEEIGLTRQRYYQLMRSGVSLGSVADAAVKLGVTVQLQPDGRAMVWGPDVAPIMVG